MKDIGFVCEEAVFRMRACGIIMKDGKVLMMKNERDPYIYSVGGAVKLCETTEEAAEREVFEETGVRMKAVRLLFIHENFFKDSESRPFHETAFYYLMDYKGEENLHPDNTGLEIPEELVWVDIDMFLHGNIFPSFFCEKLKNLKDYPERIVTSQL